MNRRGRNILVLSIAILSLVIIYSYLTLKKPSAPPEDTEAAVTYQAPLASINPLDVNRVTVSGVGGFSLERDGTGFRLVSPALEYPLLDQDAVERLFSFMARPVPDELVHESLPIPQDFGLDTPIVVKAEYGERPGLTLEFGGSSPGGKTYGRVSGDTRVWTFSKSDTGLFIDGLDALRSTTLPFVDLQDLQSLVIQTAGKTIELVREDSSEEGFYLSPYRLLAPYPTALPVDSDSLSRLIASIAPFSIASFVDGSGSLSSYGLEPQKTMFLLRDSTQELKIIVGHAVPGSEGEVYAKLDTVPFVFTIKASSLAFMNSTSAFDLVAKLPMLVPVDSIDMINVDHEGIRRTLSIVRSAVKPGAQTNSSEEYFASGRPVDKAIFLEAYKALIGIAIEGDLPASLKGSIPAQASLVITMRRSDGKGELSYQFFDVSKDFMAYRWAPGLWFAVSISQVKAAMAEMDRLLQP